MAAQAAISRQSYPPISSYQTPQSNSPASIRSPQTDAHGRGLYSMPSMGQHMYYPQYQMPQQSSYGQPPPTPHHQAVASTPGSIMSYQVQQPHHQPLTQPQSSLQIDTKPPPSSLQRTSSVSMMNAPQQSPQTPAGPAPGPIPATTPLVVRQDGNGVQWIAFEYSRDRVKMEYTIRCDVESVRVEDLSPDFKSANCVYPRACCNKDQYKGNRLHYESECNAVGWALAQLNPNLREKRGLIQRAVDSWRNSNQDPRLRSRRVRRMAKVNTRKSHLTSGPAGSAGAALQQSQAGNEYTTAPAIHHQNASGTHGHAAGSPSATPRYTHNFYPSFSQPSNASGSSIMPSVQDGMDSMQNYPVEALATPIEALSKDTDEKTQRTLFGDVPESKRRKFILVDDTQRGTRVRVRVMLDQVKMDDMPDAHLRINAVYPRSYSPRQMRSPPRSPLSRGRQDEADDDDDVEVEGVSGTLPTVGRTMVPVSLMDGSEAQMPVPRMTKSWRANEVALNELGYRMSWGQARTFNGRTLFLQRSLDAYRNKMRTTMTNNTTQKPSTMVPHFETRPGKRRWLERNKHAKRAGSP